MEGSAVTNAGSTNTNQAAGKTEAPQVTKGTPQKAGTAAPKGNASKASTAVGERKGDPGYTGQNLESAADRAIARKDAQDAKKKAQPKQDKGKVKSLADIRKLHSSQVKEPKTNAVLADNAALENPKLEPGRAEPKVGRHEVQDPNEVFEDVQEPTEEVEEIAEPEQEAADLDVEPVETEETEVDEPQFQAKDNYKAYGEDYAVPDFLKPLIQDDASEKQVHELLSKSTAFDQIKTKHIQMQEQVNNEIIPRLQMFEDGYSELSQLAQSGDIFAVLEKFGLDERKVLQAAAHRVELMSAGPEVRAEHEARIKAERQQRESERRLAHLEKQTAESNRLAKKVAFESALTRPEIASMVSEFDQKLGRPGAFVQMVAQNADSVYRRSVELAQRGQGRVIDMTPDQAIADFMRIYGLKAKSAEELQAQAGQNPLPRQPVAQTSARPAPQQATPPKARVIPNIAGRNTASGTSSRPVIKSAQDIRNLAKQKFGH